MNEVFYANSRFQTVWRKGLERRQVDLLLFSFLETGSMAKCHLRKWGILMMIAILSMGNMEVGWSARYSSKPSFCDYEIDMNWKEADTKASPAYKAGAIGIASSSGGDRAIIIKANYNFWIHGSNRLNDNSYYYRLMVTEDADPTLYLDEVSISHSTKTPLWIRTWSYVTIKLIGSSSFTARQSGDYGIEMTDARSRLTVEDYEDGSLSVQSQTCCIYGGSSFTLTSGKLNLSCPISGSAILTSDVSIVGGDLETRGAVYGICATRRLDIKGGKVHPIGNSGGIATPIMEQTNGYVILEESDLVNYNNNGEYRISGGTLITKSATSTKLPQCKKLQITGGSVRINTLSSGVVNSSGTPLYRVKVRAWGLTNGVDYSCSYGGNSFKAQPYEGYFHFWLPATEQDQIITIDRKQFPVDRVKNANEGYWFSDPFGNLDKNWAPIVVREVNSVSILQNRYFDFSSAFTGVTTGNTLNVQYTHLDLCNSTFTSTKTSTLNFNGYTLSGTGKISVTAGLLTLTNESSGVKGGTTMPVEVGSGNVRMKEVSKVPNINNIKIDNQQVWWGQVEGTSWENVKNVTQGDRSLTTLGRHYFVDSDKSFYCWLNNTTNSLAFNAGTSIEKYYYTSNPDPSQKHGQRLTATTYKVFTETTPKTWYKTLTEAFSNVSNQQTLYLADDISATNETSTLRSYAGEVTLDLQTFTLGGTKTLNANGSRLILTATDGKGNSAAGKLDGTTNLAGLVYSDLPMDQLGNGIKRNNNLVYRYYANKMLVKNRVFYAWDNDQQADEAMIHNDKACLWLPAGGISSGTVSLGYSRDMTKDKCGELHNVPSMSVHAANPELVHPYVNLSSSHLGLNKVSNNLVVTHNGVTVTDFSANQPVVVYGSNGKRGITVADNAEIQKLILRNLNVSLGADHNYAPIRVGSGSTLHLYLTGESQLKGGGQGSDVKAGIEVAPTGHLHLYNDEVLNDPRKNQNGCLYVKGGAHIQNAAAGIGGSYGKQSGSITIHSGTIQAEGGLSSCLGIGNGAGLADSDPCPTVEIQGGSVKTNREWASNGTLKQSFKNTELTKGGDNLYLMTVNTGLAPRKTFLCMHDGVTSAFPAMTDEYGKYYFWIPTLTQADKPKAEFTDPATQNSTTVQLVKIDPNDLNVAPIVCELEVEGQKSVYYNNLRDAFEAIPDKATATVKLLTDIDNLSTLQTVKTGCDVTLDLDRFNLDTKNSNAAGFEVQNGGYLFVTGRGTAGTGNIKSTFKLSGDIYIAGLVPLTDATPLQNGKAVFRTLVIGLPDNPGNIYTYSYGNISNHTFYLHDGMACLWLPDASGELTFRVTQGNNVTEYTAGTITTNTQRTEAMGCQAVGVIARVLKGEQVRDFNDLATAFAAAAETEGNTVQLLANVSLTKSLTIAGQYNFTLNLNGMSLAGTTGTSLTVSSGRYLTVADQSTGVKGSLPIKIVLQGQLFVAGNINMSGNVTSSTDSEDYLWRVIADVSNVALLSGEVTLSKDGVTYRSDVHDNEACFWLSKADALELPFTVDGNDYKISGVNINAGHQDNLVILGVGNDEAKIGSQAYQTFAAAWAAAESGDEIFLLKDATLAQPLSLTGDKKISVDVSRYTLSSANENLKITVTAGSTLLMNSSNGNGRMQVPVVNQGVLYVGSGIQPDRLSQSITDSSNDKLWRVLVTNLPDGMPDDGVYNFSYGGAQGQTAVSPQTGTFYVKQATACLWLKERKAETLTFTQFNSFTNNVTTETNHANQVIWGQNNVAQVQNTMYTSLKEAFVKNTNQTVTLLKSAVLENSQDIATRMTLEMEGYSVSPNTTTTEFVVQPGGSLQVAGKGSIFTNFKISLDPSHLLEGSNANLIVEPDINMNGQVADVSSTAYWRTTVHFPSNTEKCELEYEYNTQTGIVTFLPGKPVTLWLTPSEADKSYELKFKKGQDIWLATSVKISSTHVNLVTVQFVSDEAYIPQGGKDEYHKTLGEALTAAKKDQTVVLGRDLPEVKGEMALTVADDDVVKLDLDSHSLTGAKDMTLNAAKGQLVVKNGTLKGFLTVKGDVFADASINMNGLQVSDEAQKTVWRTLLTSLPVGTKKFEYKWSDGLKADADFTICTNIDGEVACLWLPSSNQVRSLVVKAGEVEYALNNVIVASTHGNELDITGGNNPVARTPVDDKTFASLASALATVAEGETVELMKDISLASVQDVGKSLKLDLKGFSFTSGNSGFNVDKDKTLTITNGMLLGTLRLQGEGAVAADKTVKIGGFVFNKENKEVYRTQVKVNGQEQCHWLTPKPLTYDLLIPVNLDSYEATVPAGLADHNTELTAYKRVPVSGDASWNSATFPNTNLVLESNAVLTISGASNATIHRLTIKDGAKVTIDNGSQVTAEEGIHYMRTFKTEKIWESVALPFTTTRITAELPDATGGIPGATVTTLLVPATGAGTAGHFWLNTLDANGRLQNVSTTEMTANVSCLMAVPDALKDKAITFVSGPNQLLRRGKVMAVKPASGFAAYANGTLGEVTVAEPCYLLNANGQQFDRQDGTSNKVLPFRGYLLADVTTTTIMPRLMVAGGPVAIEPIAPVGLKIFSGRGRLVLESDTAVRISVYTLGGYCVRSFQFSGGRAEVTLPAGFYVVNGQKVVVR